MSAAPVDDEAFDPTGIRGRTILVTGASSGIGCETAVHLSRLGASVIAVGRNAERLAETRSRLAGGEHWMEVVDLEETDAIPSWMKAVAGRSRPLDGLVHCAGVDLVRPVRAMQPDDLDRVMRINVGAALALARGFRQRDVCNGGGSIVYLSSAAGLAGEAGRAAYSAAKAGLIGLTRSLALELARESIRVNCVAPGVVDTPMWRRFRASMTDEQADAIEAKHPLGIGTPLDVANAIAFLVGENGRWITGTTLVVDGGLTAA